MTRLSELLEVYEHKRAANEARAALMFNRAQRRKEEAEVLEKEAERKRRKAEKLLEDMGNIPTVDWKSEVIEPLAEELAKLAGKKALTFGPCGIGAKVTIVLVDSLDVRWTEQDRLELTVEPDFEGDRMVFKYETGEVSDDFKPGTVGFVNGLNNITARLPDSVEEILGLFRPYHAAVSSAIAKVVSSNPSEEE